MQSLFTLLVVRNRNQKIAKLFLSYSSSGWASERLVSVIYGIETINFDRTRINWQLIHFEFDKYVIKF